MSVALLLITHGRAGESLLMAARGMLGKLPLDADFLAVTQVADPERSFNEAGRLCREMDRGEGVLVLTDMFGATPSNIATGLLPNPRIRVVAGINLPMLIRVFNYPHLPLEELAAKALSGGRDGILVCEPQNSERSAQ